MHKAMCDECKGMGCGVCDATGRSSLFQKHITKRMREPAKESFMRSFSSMSVKMLRKKQESEVDLSNFSGFCLNWMSTKSVISRERSQKSLARVKTLRVLETMPEGEESKED